MKKIILAASVVALAMTSCGKQQTCNCNCGCDKCACNADTTVAAVDSAVSGWDYVVRENLDLAQLPQDKDGYYVLFDGKTLNGWRGYNRDDVPGRWTVDNGTIKFSGTGSGEAQGNEGGDLIFDHKFKNFELDLEYKISEGGNSGIFYLAEEAVRHTPEGDQPLAIWQTASEFQVLDNERHPDAKLGVDGNRQAGSLYDMIPAKPQNAKPAGEWNKAKITVYKGTVIHNQNGQNVVEYHLWTPQWNEMLKNSKFAPGGPCEPAYDLLSNMGGDNHEGYIGFQDHGDDVWYRNIRVKVLD